MIFVILEAPALVVLELKVDLLARLHSLLLMTPDVGKYNVIDSFWHIFLQQALRVCITFIIKTSELVRKGEQVFAIAELLDRSVAKLLHLIKHCIILLLLFFSPLVTVF